LRTLVLVVRELSTQDYESWNKEYENAIKQNNPIARD
jgi:hypothetical protein